MRAGGPTWRDVVARWPLALGVLLIAVATSAVIGFVTPRAYESSVQLYVYAASDLEAPTIGQIVKANQFAAATAELAPTVITGDANLSAVIDELSLSSTRPELAAKIGATTVADSSIVTVTVTDLSPEDAEIIAASVARTYIRSLASLEGETGVESLPLEVTATQLREPSTGTEPSTPNLPALLAIGAIVGLLVGGIVAYTVAAASRGVGSLTQLSAGAGAPIMATLGGLDPRTESATSTLALRLHWLAVRLGRLARTKGARSIALTGAGTVDVRALAERVVSTLQADGVKVHVVDLIGDAPGEPLPWRSGPDELGLAIDEARTPLSPAHLREARASFEASHDLVLWLVDPVAESAEAITVAGGVDGTLLVVDRAVALADVRDARAAMEFTRGAFAGVIVTSTRRADELGWDAFLEGEPAAVGVDKVERA